MIQRRYALAPVCAVAALLAGCGSSDSASSASSAAGQGGAPACATGSLTASGSTALLPLVQKAAQAYEAKCSGASITVSGGGSSTGLSNVAAGTSTIGDSDVPASNAHGIDTSKLVDHQVAIVVFAVVANKQAGVTKLTTSQVRQIFSGQVTNWSAVGGANMPISVYLRKTGSGTRLSFDKCVMNGTAETTSPAGAVDSTQQVLTDVANAPGGISYMAASSVKGDSVVALDLDGNAPTASDVQAGSYSFYSHEHMYTASGGSNGQLADSFIQFILDQSFQSSTVTSLGFLPASAQSKPSAADQ